MSKSLHVVFYDFETIRDVAFITYCKKDVITFFSRSSRQNSYFHVEVKDKKKIALFERDFGDRFCEVEGSVCMLSDEYEMMCNSIPELVNGLADHIKLLTESIPYLQLSEHEEKYVIEMLKIYYTLVKTEYDCESDDEIFNMELLMDRYLKEIGV